MVTLNWHLCLSKWHPNLILLHMKLQVTSQNSVEKKSLQRKRNTMYNSYLHVILYILIRQNHEFAVLGITSCLTLLQLFVVTLHQSTNTPNMVVKMALVIKQSQKFHKQHCVITFSMLSTLASSLVVTDCSFNRSIP